MKRHRFLVEVLLLLSMLVIVSCAGTPDAVVEEPQEPAGATEAEESEAGAAEEPQAEEVQDAEVETEGPVYGGTLRVGWLPQSRTFDPHLSVQWPERFVMYTIFNTLVGVDSGFNIVPELAESWDISEDGRRITFDLREGVEFHDGTPFNAEAVKWNIERVLNEEFNSPQRQQLEPAIASIEVADEYRVEFNLKQPWPPLLAALAERPGFMVSPTAAEQFGEDFGRNPVGTGPFKFVEWVQDDHVYVEKNDGYWDEDKPYLDRIEFLVVPDPTVRTTMLRSGEVDVVTEIDAKDVPGLEETGEIEIQEVNPPARWTAMQWNVDEPPFDNKSLRQAVAYCVDRGQILDTLLLGYGMVAKGPVVPGVWWWSEDVNGFERDVDKAQELLVEAGYEDGFSHTFVVQNSSDWIRTGELVQQQLAECGIDIEFELVNPADSYAQVVEDKTNWTFTNWTQRGDPNGLLFILYHSEGPANTTEYSNPEVDRLLDEAATLYDPAARKPLYEEAEQLIIDDAPYVYLNYTTDFAAMNEAVENWEWIPDLVPRFRDLWLSQ